MNGPRRNHVEIRSTRQPARQFVSDSHDHKPDSGGRNYPPLKEATLFDKIQFLPPEFEALAAKLKEASHRLQIAVHDKSFAAARSAFLDIDTYTDQLAMMKGSLSVALEREAQRELLK